MTRAVLDSGWLIDTPIMDQLFKAIQLVLKEPQQGRSPAHEKDTKTFQEILYDTHWMSWASWWQLEGRSNLEVVIINNGALHHWYVLAPDNQASYACLATSVHPKFIYATVDWFLKANGKQSCRTYHSPEVYPKLLEKWMINEEEFKKALANYIEGDPKDFISDLEEVKIEAQRHDAANSLAPGLIPILQAMPDNNRKADAMTLWKEVVQYHIYRKYQDRLTELLDTLNDCSTTHQTLGWHKDDLDYPINVISTYLKSYSPTGDRLEVFKENLQNPITLQSEMWEHSERWNPRLLYQRGLEMTKDILEIVIRSLLNPSTLWTKICEQDSLLDIGLEMKKLYSKLWPETLDATYKKLKRNTNSQTNGPPAFTLYSIN